MFLKGLIILFMIGACHNSMLYSSRLKLWLETWKIKKEILLTSYNSLLLEWKTFKETYGKRYNTEMEDLKHLEIFAHNKLIIARHNDLYENGDVTFTLKMNKFGDMTTKQFNAYYGFNNTKIEKEDENRKKISPLQLAGVTTPAEKDWRKDGAVTKVKHQQPCSSSWAFSITGALEGYYFIKNNYLLALSEQYLIDCLSIHSVNSVCSAERPSSYFNSEAFEKGLRTKGMASEMSYPYRGVKDFCRYNKKNVYILIDVDTFYPVPQFEEDVLQNIVGVYGPASVMVDTSDETFRFYEKGVYFSEKCSSKSANLNNAMLVVGYGTAPYGGDYWLVKNSLGNDWGEEGYIKMVRNRGNNCGIATEAFLPY